ncbi:hypothetical protein J6590_101976 [Homalodisca vitripennis]|nr:hypothetical protein J6590_101976 [Homalodisca vitripennis]
MFVLQRKQLRDSESSIDSDWNTESTFPSRSPVREKEGGLQQINCRRRSHYRHLPVRVESD